jgi:hypothetical protein
MRIIVAIELNTSERRTALSYATYRRKMVMSTFAGVVRVGSVVSKCVKGPSTSGLRWRERV